MKDLSFSIPEEFKSQLKYVPSLDSRSDTEILSSLTQHVPITSEKNIWTYWHAGVGAMPGWCQRNIANWIRLNGPSWTVRVLDNIPGSPNNALKWVEKELLPKCFVEGTMDGPYTGPHSADFLRGGALWKYGGVWMDVGILLIRKLDGVCWKQLEDPNSPFEVSVPWMYGVVMANHFVAGRKGNGFIKRWHDLFISFWENRTNTEGISQNPLVAFAQSLDFSESQRRNFNWEFIVGPLTVFEYIAQCLSWMRVAMLIEPGPDGFDGAAYYQNNVLLFDSLSEDWGAEEAIGFVGQDLFDVLATRYDADPESEQYKKAWKCVWRLLTKSSMQKITHGKHLTKDPALGILWDREENASIDVKEGTFAELLRYGSVFLEQTREGIEYVEAPRDGMVIRKGLFEA